MPPATYGLSDVEITVRVHNDGVRKGELASHMTGTTDTADNLSLIHI